jgi:hypothetical protein
MKRTRLSAIAAVLSLAALLAMAGPASAWVVVKQSGMTGDYGSQISHTDQDTSPGARCGYSAPDSGGWAYLRWIKVYHYLVAARDITADRDSQIVSFQALVQRQTNGGTWKTVARSAVQKMTSHDDQGPTFNDPKLMVHGTSANQHFRALVILKWWRNGGVEGSIKIRLQYYGVKWTVGNSDYVWTNACDGAAD